MVGQSVLSFDVFSLTSRSTFGIYIHGISLCSKFSPNFCLFCLPHKKQRRQETSAHKLINELILRRH